VLDSQGVSPKEGHSYVEGVPMVYLDPNQRCEIIFLETDASTSLLRPITVLVADDHALIRSAISQVLTSQPKVEQVVMVKDYTEAEVQGTKLCPDIHLVGCILHAAMVSRRYAA
jgi:hypothetical protein